MTFAAEIEDSEGDEFDEDLTYKQNVVSNDEDVYGWLDESDDEDSRDEPLTTDFDMNGPSDSKANDKRYEETQNASTEFLKWNQQLGHISPNKMRVMTKIGILPKRLASYEIPICTSCLYGKATRRPW